MCKTSAWMAWHSTCKTSALMAYAQYVQDYPFFFAGDPLKNKANRKVRNFQFLPKPPNLAGNPRICWNKCGERE